MFNYELFKTETEINDGNFGDALQQALEIEIATIPVYLFTYYSINRSPNQTAISSALITSFMAGGMGMEEAKTKALEMSAEVMVFANKAGALIMSVAVEEMLHMAIAANIKQAYTEEGPQIIGRSPSSWPAYLPGHDPKFPIDRRPLSHDQLMTFLKIESPKPFAEKNLKTTVIEYKTIGLFYEMVKAYLTAAQPPCDGDKPQLLKGNGYYAPNNIDTLFYNKEHKPNFVNAEDSGDLVHIKNAKTACDAIDIIIEQGEGNNAPGFDEHGQVNCAVYDGDFDDKSKSEVSHFEKFSRVYCQLRRLTEQFEQAGIDEATFQSFFIRNFKKNPSTSEYPANLQALSTLIDGVYSYIFVMIENCYRKTEHTQYEIFMMGVHKSMIFILDWLCGTINGYTYTDAKTGVTYTCAATFQDYQFGLMSSPKSQLLALFANALTYYPSLSYMQVRFDSLPDVSL